MYFHLISMIAFYVSEHGAKSGFYAQKLLAKWLPPAGFLNKYHGIWQSTLSLLSMMKSLIQTIESRIKIF